jgi:hypothetical protein
VQLLCLARSSDQPSGTTSLPRPKKRLAFGRNFSSLPDDVFGPRVNSLPRPSLALATNSAANPTDGHSAQLWHMSGDGSSSTSGRLPPHSSGAPTSISAAGNLDVIPCKDADAPRKQPLAHTPAMLHQLRHGQPLPRGLGHTGNSSTSASALSGDPAGASQHHYASSRRPAGRQDVTPSTTTPGFVVDAPLPI